MGPKNRRDRRPRPRLRPAVDRVEARRLLATFTVVNTLDGGTGSLRQAILDANALPNPPGQPDLIVFAFQEPGVQRIAPLSNLPTVTDPVTIDGSSQLTDAGGPAIVLDGLSSSGSGPGLRIAAGFSVVRSLVIGNFIGPGILVQAPTRGGPAGGVFLVGNRIGTDPTGTIAAGNGSGIRVTTSGVLIGGTDPADANVISGNFGPGVSLRGLNNRVSGNFIGTDPTGLTIVANGGSGVDVQFGADGNTIGGPDATFVNVISGNNGSGILLASSRNVIQSSFIGTSLGLGIGDPFLVPLPNGGSGIQVVSGASGNTIGGLGAGNLIAANLFQGINFAGQNNFNLVQGNAIGASRAVGGGIGMGPGILGNGGDGIRINSSSLNTIGGPNADLGNVISGNRGGGITVVGNDPSLQGRPGNLISGNRIGTNLEGTIAIPNATGGIVLGSSANNTIGGTVPGALNLISANGGVGLSIQTEGATTGLVSTGNLVVGNAIGTDLAGTRGMGNAGIGIVVLDSPGNIIGSSLKGTRGNLISANAGHGILIAGAGASGNSVFANLIGLNLAGAPLGNAGDGVHVAALNVTIGSAFSSDRNVISGNQGAGIAVVSEFRVIAGKISDLFDVGGRALILGNYVGTGPDGRVTGQGNQQDGILFRDASVNTIGGQSGGDGLIGEGNVVSGNRQSGIHVVGSSTVNVLAGNIVGLNVDGTRGSSGNFLHGVFLDGTSGNTIGGLGTDATGRRGNTLSGNGGSGLRVEFGSVNLIRGNRIGTDPTATLARGNSGDGITIIAGSANTIGGDGDAGNVIAANGSNGVSIVGRLVPTGPVAGGNAILGNLIGVDVSGAGRLGNGLNGVVVADSPSNTIGGSAPGARNVLSANGLNGVLLSGALTTASAILGNTIGTDAAGRVALGNARDGILIDAASINSVGGAVFGAGNLISGNGVHGVEIRGASASANLVSGNVIGTDRSGSGRLGNAGDGVLIVGASANLIGGASALARNLISGNGGNGVEVRDAGALSNVVSGNAIGTDASGAVALGNGQSGVALGAGAVGTVVGGLGLGAGNLISGNVGSGLQLFRADGNRVFGNRIGTDAAGTRAVGNNLAGVAIFDAADNLIGFGAPGAGNLISGNGSIGVAIAGPAATRNAVRGNLIGSDEAGIRRVGNATNGVSVDDAPANTIGGETAGEGNLIVGNRAFGLTLANPNATGTLIAGNFIGTNAAGATGLGNSLDGLLVVSTPGPTIGGPAAGAGNVVSGNGGNGIRLSGVGGALLQGNVVGADPTGTRAVGNAFDGLLIDGSTGILVDGTRAPNLFSGNGQAGIDVIGGSTGVRILANVVGLDRPGVSALGNRGDGIVVTSGRDIAIGGASEALGNLVSGNLGVGIHLVNSSGNLVRGNLVGTNRSGAAPLGNALDGIALDASAGNQVGGLAPGAGNVVSANGRAGLRVTGAGADGNTLEGNTVGTDRLGTLDLGNAIFGVTIESASNTLVRSSLISGNGVAGVRITGQASIGNRVVGSTIGTDRAGGASISNDFGILVDGASRNTIGGESAGEGNLISGNATAGIHLFGRFSSANVVVGNTVGTGRAGQAPIAVGEASRQQVGVLINESPGLDVGDTPGPGNTIGGATPAARNLISGNVVGVEINGSGGRGNLVSGNLIGPTSDGSRGAGNTVGVFLNAAPGNTIGGTAGNVISANASVGVYILAIGSTGNVISRNLIGTTPDGLKALGNGIGVYVENAPANTFGGPSSADRNVIATNPTAGVYIIAGQSVGNVVRNNIIGAGLNRARLGRQQYGVLLYNAPNNTIARTGPGANLTVGSTIANFREFTGRRIVANPTDVSPFARARRS